MIFLWKANRPIAKWSLSYIFFFFLSLHYKIRKWEARSSCPSGSAGINTVLYHMAPLKCLPIAKSFLSSSAPGKPSFPSYLSYEVYQPFEERVPVQHLVQSDPSVGLNFSVLFLCANPATTIETGTPQSRHKQTFIRECSPKSLFYKRLCWLDSVIWTVVDAGYIPQEPRKKGAAVSAKRCRRCTTL